MVCVSGKIFFNEKLNKFKRIAIGFALVGLAIMIIGYRELPVIALGLALSFASYAAIKKTYKLPVMQALFYETAILVPIALIVILHAEFTGTGLAGNIETKKIILLSLRHFDCSAYGSIFVCHIKAPTCNTWLDRVFITINITSSWHILF